MVGMVGLIKDAGTIVTQGFKNDNDAIVLLGENKADLSGSEYLYIVHKQKKGNPRIDIEKEKAVQQACLEAIESGIINSAHDCSDGGLAVTLAESCITNEKVMLGAQITVDGAKDIRVDELLFGEAPSRIVVSLNKDNLASLEKIAKKYAAPYQVLGKVTKERLVIRYNSETVIDQPVEELSRVWRNAIPSRIENGEKGDRHL
jgi:phosphoribosylformylglycinamidine synthase